MSDPLYVAPSSSPIDLSNDDTQAAALDPVTRAYRSELANVLSISAKKRIAMNHSVPLIDEMDDRVAKLEFTAVQKLTNAFMRTQRDGIMFAILLLVVFLFLISSFYVFTFQNTIIGSVVSSLMLGQVLQPMDYYVPGLIREKIRTSTESFMAGPRSYNNMLDRCKHMSSEFYAAMIAPEISENNERMFVVNKREMTMDDVMRNYIQKYFLLVMAMSHMTLRIFIGDRDKIALPFNVDTVGAIEDVRMWLQDKDDPISILRGLIVQTKRLLVECSRQGLCYKPMFQNVMKATNGLLNEIDRVQMDAKIKPPVVIGFFLSFTLIAYFFFLYPAVVYGGVGVYAVIVIPIVCLMALAVPYMSFWLRDPFAGNSRSKLDFHGWRVAAQTLIAKDCVSARNFYKGLVGVQLQRPPEDM